MSKSEILETPGIYGWDYKGVIVAPASSDPYLLNQAAVKLVIEKLRGDGGAILPAQDEVDNLLNELYQMSYKHSGVAFRPGAKDFLLNLNRAGDFTVVTNSEKDAVRKKVALLLGDDNDIKVVGNAKKYAVDETWDAVQEIMQPTGFPRPVYLRRKKYGEVLKAVGNVDTVVGDIYELDLVLPQVMGITTVLVTSLTTPDWEVAYYKDHPNGFSSSSLEEIADRIIS